MAADALLNSSTAVAAVLVVVYVSGRERGAERAAGKVAMVEPLGAVVSWLKTFTKRSLASAVGSQVGRGGARQCWRSFIAFAGSLACRR